MAYWRRPAAALGWLLAGFTVWLALQLRATYGGLQANPMLVPRLGPGLFLSLGGSLVVGLTLAVRLTPRSTTAFPRPS